jgi:hypothetical protein
VVDAVVAAAKIASVRDAADRIRRVLPKEVDALAEGLSGPARSRHPQGL